MLGPFPVHIEGDINLMTIITPTSEGKGSLVLVYEVQGRVNEHPCYINKMPVFYCPFHRPIVFRGKLLLSANDINRC
jgi:hypothetical protein